jgi:hypothetical protein
MSEKGKMTFEEMAQLVDDSREAEFYRHQAEQRKWEREQREKANAVVAKLEQHLPSQVWQEVLELSEEYFGGKCIMFALFKKAGRDDLAESHGFPY